MNSADRLGSYYTPPEVAQELIRHVSIRDPRGILDPAVGDGALLTAAKSILGTNILVGIDLDQSALRCASRNLPSSTLSCANILARRSVFSSSAYARRDEIDLVLANPPFSAHYSTRSHSISFMGAKMHGSLALAYIAQTLCLFSPIELVAIVPSSLLHAESNASLLAAISHEYDINALRRLSPNTFSGCRASTQVVRWRKFEGGMRSRLRGTNPSELSSSTSAQICVVRGGLPVHQLQQSVLPRSVSLIHTTSLSGAPENLILPRVNPIERGRISGPCVLLPRVGFPKRSHIRAIDIGEFQLSDCVIGLCTDSTHDARNLATLLRDRFEDLHGLYGGTGAAYTTIGKVQRLLHQLGFSVETAPNRLISKVESIPDICSLETPRPHTPRPSTQRQFPASSPIGDLHRFN